MAYRRKGGITKAGTFKDEEKDEHNENENENEKNEEEKVSKSASASLAARATRASAAHRDSSGYAYAYASPSPSPSSDHFRSLSFPKQSQSQSQSGSTASTDDDPRYGFWGVLARKAKSILEDEPQPQHHHSNINSHLPHTQIYQSSDNAPLRNRLDAITSSLNNFGDSLGNAFEEGRSLMEHKTADIIHETRSRTADFIQETRKLQLRRRPPSSSHAPPPDQPTVVHHTSWQRPVLPSVHTNSPHNQQTQLKASRDVAMATAAKAKVLLRELKTVKADLAFAKERCAQLEEENKRLRENREKGDNPADDDLIRLQLETLLAEKARLAHENSLYARENRFLREIVEYHQLTMQDVVYLDEGTEQVTEVYPFSIDDAKELSSTPKSPISQGFLPEVSSLRLSPERKDYTTEVPNDVFNASPYSSPSATFTVYPTSCPPSRTESSEVPALSKLVANEETETSYDTEPSIDAHDAPK